MSIRTLVIVFVLLAAAQPQSVDIPDTPAGHTLKVWLDAFNSGDRAAEEKYLKTYDPERSLDDEMRFRGMTGGFVLTQILKSDPQRIEFMVKEHNSDTVAMGKMELKPGEPIKVASFGLRAIPPGTKATDLSFKIDAACWRFLLRPRTCRMCSASISSTENAAPSAGLGAAVSPARKGRSLASIRSPLARIVARSITLRSSRMLPGHE